MEMIEPRDRHKIRAVGVSVGIDLKIGAGAVRNEAHQRSNRLPAAVVEGGREQGRKIDLIALGGAVAAAVALVIIGDPIENCRRGLRIAERRRVEDECVVTGAAGQKVAADAASKGIVSAIADKGVIEGGSDDAINM